MSRAADVSWRRKLSGSTEPGRRVARPAPLQRAAVETIPSWARVDSGTDRVQAVGPGPDEVHPWRRFVLLAVAELIFTIGALVLLYVLWSVLIADAVTRADQAHVAAELHAAWSRVPASTNGSATVPIPRAGQAFAVMYVPRFGTDWRRPVIEGTALSDLSRGVGHYRGTALPGDVGNVAVAGHRLTHGSAFMKIADLRSGDAIVLETPTRWYLYRVFSTLIVTPDRIDVIAPVPEHPGQQPTRALLTLTSCNPLFGHSHRYIVHAALVGSWPHADGPPQGTVSVG